MFRYFILGIIFSIIATFITQYFYTGFDLQQTFSFILGSHKFIFIYSSIIIFSLYIWAAALTGSSILGSSFILTLSLIISTISYVKFQYRNEPLFPNELSMIKNFPALFTMVNLTDIIISSVGLLILILFICIVYRKFSIRKTSPLTKHLHYGWRVTSFILSTLFLFYVSQFNNPGNLVKKYYSSHAEWVSYNQTLNYSKNGFISGFLFNLGSIYMEEPPNYSKKSIQNIYEKYTSSAADINKDRLNYDIDTNLIFIMNETFTDPTVINGFSTDKDPIPYTRQLMKDTLSGNSLALNIGGGTANSEFEALTSISLEPFSPQVYAPFVEATDTMNDATSLAKKASSSNLKPTAIHPYLPNLYKRLSVYEDLGFEEFIHSDFMTYTNKIENNPYISDLSAYKETIDTIEKSNKKDFIHLVTMQNHGAYRDKYSNPSFITSGTKVKEDGNGYMEDLHNSDLALEEMIKYIDNQEEDILLVFWGNHLPGIYPKEISSQNSKLSMRETPLFFYSNKHDLSGDVGSISPIYYLNHILEILNIKVNPHEALLYELEQQLPGLLGGIYLENDLDDAVPSKENLSKDTLEIYDDYTLLQYDIISGSQYAKDLGFFELNMN